MKISAITYTASAEYHSGSRESITLAAELEEGDQFDKVLLELKQKVHLKLNDLNRYSDALDNIQKAERQLFDLKEIYEEAREKYEEVKGIMKAAGVSKEYPDFPVLSSKVVKALSSNGF